MIASAEALPRTFRPPLPSAKQIFDWAVCSAIDVYQWANQGGRLIRTSADKKLGMEILTGDHRTSEFTRKEVLRQKTLCQGLAALGGALIYIYESCLEIDADQNRTAISVSYPPASLPISIHLMEKDTHLEVPEDITALSALALGVEGLWSLSKGVGRSCLRQAVMRVSRRERKEQKRCDKENRRKYGPGIPEGARVTGVRRNRREKVKEVDIERQIPAPFPSKWSKKSRQPITEKKTLVPTSSGLRPKEAVHTSGIGWCD